MPIIPPEIIDEIRARADIVDVIGAYAPLKRAGTAFEACCPFHQEKTPSFKVNPQRQYYHCFGCGAHGNVFTFVMAKENVDFPTAARILAQRFSVYIPEPEERPRGGNSRYQRAEDAPASSAQRRNAKDRLYLLHEKLAVWYRNNLTRFPDSPVSKYLVSRGLEKGSEEKFRLGASPDSFSATMDFLRKEGFSEEEMATAGVIKVTGDRPPKKYDMFRNRLMFPIWDETGRVIGFSARTIEAHPDRMKYVNTPETPLFKKRRVLYAMHFARPETAHNKRDSVILCEGQLDVIAMHASGFTNAVAAEGTAFTEDHAAILRRWTPNILLALDSDNAGTKAIFNDAAILLPLGFNVKVIRFPGGKDPDELMKTHGREAVAEAVAAARDFFEFAFDHYSALNTGSPAGKAKTASDMLSFVAMLEDDAAQAAYSAWLAGKLALDSGAMTRQLEKTVDKRKRELERFRYYGEQREQTEKTEVPAPVRRPKTRREVQYEKSLLEMLDAILRSQKAVELAAQTVTPEMTGDSPLAAAVNDVINAHLLDEWQDAPQKILDRFSGEAQPDERLSELLVSDLRRTDGEDGEIVPVPENATPEQIKDIERAKLKKRAKADAFACAVVSECIKKIDSFVREKKIAELIRKVAEMSADDPAQAECVKQIMVLKGCKQDVIDKDDITF